MKKIACMMSVLIAAVAMASAGVIYQDDFNKTGRIQGGGYTQVLKASTPSIVTTDGQWWKAYYSSAANSLGIAVSGTLNTYTSTSSGYYRNAFLDFTPQSGLIYTLSVDMSVQNIVNGSGFLTMGFSANTTLIDDYATAADAAANGTYASGEYVSAMTTALGGWKLNANKSASTYKDVLYGNEVSAGTTDTGYNTYTTVLDTTDANWTIEWLLNGSSVRTETYASNPTIANVFLGVSGLANGSYQNFSLTSAVPEPATIGMLGLGAVAVVLTRRIRR